MKVLCIPDLHFPFTDEKALDQVISIIKREKPQAVIQLGDLFDAYAFSRFARSLNVMTPQQEVELAVRMAKNFWARVKKAVPRAKLYQLKGNHDVRFQKKLVTHSPEFEHLVNFDELFRFPGVKVLKTDRDHLVLDNVVYCHGFLSKSEKHLNHFDSCVVHGHLHSSSIICKGDRWVMNCGHLADETSLPLQYTQSKVTGWTKAIGIVEDRQPRLILI